MDIRKTFFDYRSYTPIPLILLGLIFADPKMPCILIGALLMAAGEGLRFAGVAHAGPATRRTSGAGGRRLITSGPFAYVRNPLYLGNFALAFGFLLMTCVWMPWMAIVFPGIFLLQYSLIISLEEEYLENKFGSDYVRYSENVSRWLPRVTPYTGGGRNEPDFTRALRSERPTLQTIGLLLLLLFILA